MTNKDLERFYSKTKQNEITGCLEWTAGLNKGYAQFKLKQKKCQAHRALYEHFHGELSLEYDVNHICRNRKCVNIDHLEALTKAEHIEKDRDAMMNGSYLGASRAWNRQYAPRS